MNPEQENFERLRRLLYSSSVTNSRRPAFSTISPAELSSASRPEKPAKRRLALAAVLGGDGLKTLECPGTEARAGGRFQLSVCGLLLAGILCSVAPAESGRGTWVSGSQSLAAIAVPQVADPAPVFVSSTNGVLPGPLQNSLFEQFGDLPGPASVDPRQRVGDGPVILNLPDRRIRFIPSPVLMVRRSPSMVAVNSCCPPGTC